jgi:hypothetical protein
VFDQGVVLECAQTLLHMSLSFHSFILCIPGHLVTCI